ncbi:MAG: hypothetical protein EPO26_01385 [Chloroflexota bacterium]|nr:MAG: hypothetical protein EPO26_01385 [Chloroflexota bacterium]
MTQTFDAWLNAQMATKGIKSARRFGLEAGLDPSRVADWLLGAALPTDDECLLLSKYLSVPFAEINDRRFPRKR